ncbi:cell wall protein [Streptomyces sp. NRRL F-4489]|uniref:LAETG motif-containing sortase-dependent surface protein n=1 Tax=Streptomyces sp. NRRL F-4489 TaxID=1609095 RepID=UPI00074ACD0D|nr:LAETG motif-containing sortase-dependent surface protein [Streptomyces sp. NRRL F-4489]KUL51208.1 cell wall protein [Streptomyces sp. NRRL F-4489]
MKLRRALTAVAATAVIAPAALMAAPAAYATGPGTDTAATAPAPEDTPGPEQSGSTTTPDQPPAAGEQTPAGEKESGTGSTTGGTETAPSTARPSGTPGPSVSPSPSGGPTAGGKPTATPPSDKGDDEGDECTIDDPSLKTTVRNLPSKLVAGGGWSRFTVALTNTTDRKLDEVYPFIMAVPLNGDGNGPDSRLHLEYQDPDTGKWTAFGEWTNGDYFGWFELDPHETAELTMRISADKSAPAGDGFALIAGDYYNADGSCGSSAEQWYDFAILAAGSKPGQIPPAKPGKPGNKPGPQGGAKPVTPAKPKEDLAKLPVTGNLAETGSSSALPTIAMAGGLALVVGAGALFVVRRRKAGGGAAA